MSTAILKIENHVQNLSVIVKRRKNLEGIGLIKNLLRCYIVAAGLTLFTILTFFIISVQNNTLDNTVMYFKLRVIFISNLFGSSMQFRRNESIIN